MTESPKDRSSAPDRESPELGRVLEVLESAVNYRDWIFSLAAPYLGARVMELGAGTGTMFTCVVDREHAVGIEPDATLFKELEERFGALSNTTLVCGNLEDGSTVDTLREAALDSAMMFNVLEHIEDDVAALRAIASAVGAGGRLAVFVPAFPSIFGSMDRAVGHVRRYRRRELVAKMEAADFNVVAAHYVNLPGYFAWFINGRVLRSMSPAGGPRMVSIYDRAVIPPTRKIETAVHPPFGQSLFVAGVRR
ncbi:MAG TPA: methyltransferase domain-containing protein [Acidimicrobiales bacterium]|nr:methyltransferase domain-containing protein [Acidimicrobiales bacterium]